MPDILPLGQDGLLQPVSLTSRADGICHLRSPSGLSPHERVPVLGGCLWARSGTSWRMEVAGHTQVLQGAVPVEIPFFLTQGVPMEAVLSRKVVTTDASLTS